MVYLDNAATTAPSSVAIDAWKDSCKAFGNPSSVHSAGVEANKLLRISRKIIAKTIGAKDSEIIFTPSGTFANNLAIIGASKALKRKGNQIIITDSEHPSVYNTAKQLEKEGFTVSCLSTCRGKINTNELNALLNEKTVLVSVMLANNETGALYDVAAVKRAIQQRAPNAVLHCDAVQAYMKTSFNVNTVKADLISLSAHKIHGFKGCGALYVKSGIRVEPITFGGGQENGLACGTEALPAIYAFARSAEAIFPSLNDNINKVSMLYNYAKEKLSDLGFTVNEPEKHTPYVLSVTLHKVKSEVMLNFLSSKEIYVSAGSACSSHAKENRVLKAFGLTSNEADTTLRISFSEDNTTDDIDILVSALFEGINNLVKIK